MTANVRIGDFIRDEVYPKINAVEEGLLDHLNPSHRKGNGSYELNCPQCGQRRAYYYEGHSVVQCNRKENCLESPTTLWDVLAKQQKTNAEIIKLLCAAAGVKPPEREPRSGHSAPGASSAASANAAPTISPGKAIVKVTQQLALSNKKILDEFQSARGYTDEDMAAMRLGVFTTAKEVLTLLEALGIPKETAREKGYIGYDDSKPDFLWNVMDGRVVGYWPHEDGDVRLWGRIPVGNSTDKVKKYRFANSLIKDIPYLFNRRHGRFPICVEGTLDAWALQLLDHWGTAIGQAHINDAQAAYLASKGVTEAAHMVDGDGAGYGGALQSIRACEAVGITLSIIVLGAGMDDADAMRRAGRGKQLSELIASRINAGEYLARHCQAALMQSPPNIRAIAQARAIAQFLTPVSARCWEDWSRSLGVFIDEEQEALRILGGLIIGGMPVGECLDLVKRMTGYSISIHKEETVG